MANINTPHDDIPSKIAEKVCAENNGNDATCERDAVDQREKLTSYLSQHGKSEAVFKAVESVSKETGIDKMKLLASLNLPSLDKITTDIHPQGKYPIQTLDSNGRNLLVDRGLMLGEDKIRMEMAKRGIYEINIKIHPKAAGAPPSLVQNLPYVVGGKPETISSAEDEYNIYKDFYTKRIVYYVGNLVNNRNGGPMQIQKL